MNLESQRKEMKKLEKWTLVVSIVSIGFSLGFIAFVIWVIVKFMIHFGII